MSEIIEKLQVDEVPKYLNPALTIKERVEDLVSRMSIGEKLGQINCLNYL